MMHQIRGHTHAIVQTTWTPMVSHFVPRRQHTTLLEDGSILHIQNWIILTDRVKSLATCLSIDPLPAASLPQSAILHNIKNACVHQSACQREATEHRVQWLESMAHNKLDTKGNHSSSTKLKTMVPNLTNRKMNATLNHIMKSPHSGLDHIEIPTHETGISPQ
jgi:hypothetical protein